MVTLIVAFVFGTTLYIAMWPLLAAE